MKTIRHQRAGFTLPELMVAAALSMAIMGIIAIAFQKGIDTFRVLRSVGQMQEKLKSAQSVLKRDLSAEHFGGAFKPGLNGPFVRDQRLDLPGWIPPEEGFFSIMQASDNTSTPEGVDSDGIPSYRAIDHSLHFTVKLSGKRDEDNFRALAPSDIVSRSPADFLSPTGTIFASRWAEVFYFLVANGQTANGTPLYTLYRRQRLALPAGAASATISSPGSFPDVSVVGSTVNTSAALTTPNNRMPILANPSPGWRPSNLAEANAGAAVGDDILLTDVLSFEVKANWSTGAASVGIGAFPNSPATGGADWPFLVLPGSTVNATYGATRRTFDTWYRGTIDWNDPASYGATNTLVPPLRIRVNTVQIRLRIWDAKAEQARQMTIVQDI